MDRHFQFISSLPMKQASATQPDPVTHPTAQHYESSTPVDNIATTLLVHQLSSPECCSNWLAVACCTIPPAPVAIPPFSHSPGPRYHRLALPLTRFSRHPARRPHGRQTTTHRQHTMDPLLGATSRNSHKQPSPAPSRMSAAPGGGELPVNSWSAPSSCCAVPSVFRCTGPSG